MPSDRLDASNVQLLPETGRGNSIALIAGMSAKSAKVHGYRQGDWEREAARIVKAQGWEARQRPKATSRSGVQVPIGMALQCCGLLVTHHSNCAVDALIAGVPVWARAGVGELVSPTFCPAPGNAYRLTTAARRMVLADVAYAQWTVPEMRSGAAWEFMKGVFDGAYSNQSRHTESR
jgi:hypothetical protein